MKIDGRQIATLITDQLKIHVTRLKKNINPHLAVILVGDDLSSIAYINQKKRIAAEIGAQITVYHLPATTQTGELRKLTFNLNLDLLVHGVIIQRPVPLDISKDQLDSMVTPDKDVDGFHPQTQFTPPIAAAVLKILEWGSYDVCNNPESPLKQNFCETFPSWLQKQKILVIGRGETAGKPIAYTLTKMGVAFEVAHSKTTNLEELCLVANIIISCVGKRNILRHSMVSNKTILIGVGLHTENGKLKTDYDQEEIASKVAYYTPVPGGVGPVNVACLFENLLEGIQKQNNPS